MSSQADTATALNGSVNNNIISNNDNVIRQLLDFNSSDEEFVYKDDINDIGFPDQDNAVPDDLTKDYIRLGKAPASTTVQGGLFDRVQPTTEPFISQTQTTDKKHAAQDSTMFANDLLVDAHLDYLGFLREFSNGVTPQDSTPAQSDIPTRSPSFVTNNITHNGNASSSTTHILAGDLDQNLNLTGNDSNRFQYLQDKPKGNGGVQVVSRNVVDLTLSDDEEMPAFKKHKSSTAFNGFTDGFNGMDNHQTANNAAGGVKNNENVNTPDLNSNTKNETPNSLAQLDAMLLAPSRIPGSYPQVYNHTPNIIQKKEKEVIDLDDSDDDDEIQIINVRSLPKRDARFHHSDLQHHSTQQGQEVDRLLVREKIVAYEAKTEQLKDNYNQTAQTLISKKTMQRKVRENIINLKKTDAKLADKNDPIAKSMMASGRVQIQNYSLIYNKLVGETLSLEKTCETLRKSFLNLKLYVTRLKHQLDQSLTLQYPVLPSDDPVDYNREYRQAIMAQNRGYSSNVYTDDSNSLQSLLSNIKPDETYVEGQAKTPEGLGVSLLPHQRIGLAWLQAMEESSNKGGILADDMGLGKTVQALALMLANKSKDENCKTNLIVAPIALLKQWQQEIQSKIKSEYGLSTFIYHQQDKLKTFTALKQYDVILISYNTLASEMKKHFALAIEEARLAKKSSVVPSKESGGQNYVSPFYSSDLKFYRIILDEAQWVKNKLTQASKSVAVVDSELRWCLSGTPMQNSIGELYSLLRFLRIKPYNVEARFNSDILLPIKNSSSDRYDSIDTSSAMKKLQLLLKAILLRRTKDSKIDGKPILELPQKSIENENIEMFNLERDYYKNLENSSAKQADNLLKTKSKGNYSSILTLLLRLRQLCCHKYLVEMGDRKNSNYDATKVKPSVIRNIDPKVVNRIQRDTESGFTCPICFDSVANEKVLLLSPCGHLLCQDCVSQFFDQFQTNQDAEDGSRIATCMNCRAVIKEKEIFNYESFDMIFNKNFTDQQYTNAFTHDFKSNKKSDRRKNLLRLIEEDGGFKSSLKIDLCIKTMESILNANDDEKIIVFSQFTLLFEIIRIVLEHKNIPYLQYDGSMNTDERNSTISTFYRDPTKRILLLSLKAGNVGLTLTCANHVIIMDPFWNPYVEEQAMDRAHRIGQQREVHVHKLLVKDTIEDRILLLQEKKKELINGALDSEGLSTISRLGHNEIRFLFGLGNLN